MTDCQYESVFLGFSENHLSISSRGITLLRKALVSSLKSSLGASSLDLVLSDLQRSASRSVQRADYPFIARKDDRDLSPVRLHKRP